MNVEKFIEKIEDDNIKYMKQKLISLINDLCKDDFERKKLKITKSVIDYVVVLEIEKNEVKKEVRIREFLNSDDYKEIINDLQFLKLDGLEVKVSNWGMSNLIIMSYDFFEDDIYCKRTFEFKVSKF